MTKILKRYQDYLFIIAISLMIGLSIFLLKGIYPFGNHTLIYGDMQEQIASYYYYLYDCFHQSGSFFLNLTSGGGVSFFGIITYYLLNPFSLFVLFVKREEIYLFLSIIIFCKIILCNITCLYALKKMFPHQNSYLSVFLSLLYGFSIYSLNYYQITGWIDVMYLFPILFVGFKRLLDGNSSKMYWIVLTLCLWFHFYIAVMVILFLFLLAFPYLHAYGKKEEMGSRLLALGIQTVLSIGCALVILLPTLYQISISSRVSYGLESLLNSKLGPIFDKTSLFLFGPILFVGLLLLLKKWKKEKKFLSFYLPSMALLLIPVFVEPVHKLLHFGSYASFPCRFGFITVFFLILGANYAFQHEKKETRILPKRNTILSVGGTIFAIASILFLTFYRYDATQKAIESLTLSRDKTSFFLLAILFIIAFVASISVLLFQKGFHRTSYLLVASILLTHIFATSYLYLGIDFVQNDIHKIYTTLAKIHNDFKEPYYRYKNEVPYLTNNGGNVTSIPTLDHFSSLTNGKEQRFLKQLGYSSYWTRTTSYGGTLFTDILLGNQYVLTSEKLKEGFSIQKQYEDLYFQKRDSKIPYGFLLQEDVTVEDYDNTFLLQNALFHSVGGEQDLFTVLKDYDTSNLVIADEKLKPNEKATITFHVSVKGKKHLYLELYKSLVNKENEEIFHAFSIYVNDTLFLQDYPNKDFNGVVDLGVFEEEEVTVTLHVDKEIPLPLISIGLLDLEKLNTWLEEAPTFELTFDSKEITISSEDQKGILFLPLTYLEGYEATVDGEKIPLTSIYQNYLGIPLSGNGETIHLTFIPNYFKSSLLLTICFFVVALILFKTNIYSYLLKNRLLKKIAEVIYLFLYGIVLASLYLLPTISFFLSFIMKISI